MWGLKFAFLGESEQYKLNKRNYFGRIIKEQIFISKGAIKICARPSGGFKTLIVNSKDGRSSPKILR